MFVSNVTVLTESFQERMAVRIRQDRVTDRRPGDSLSFLDIPR